MKNSGSAGYLVVMLSVSRAAFHEETAHWEPSILGQRNYAQSRVRIQIGVIDYNAVAFG